MKYPLPLILLTLIFIGNAQASDTREATVYRCGKDGKDLRDSPCPDAPAQAGNAVLYDQPAAQEQRAARERANADARQANAMEKQRLAAEAQARRDATRAGALSGAPAASAPAHAKPAKPFKLPKAHRPSRPASAAP